MDASISKYISLLGLYTFLMLLGFGITYLYDTQYDAATHAITAFFVIWAIEKADDSRKHKAIERLLLLLNTQAWKDK
jgi:hypothetical protein